jgi:hypothetical protein
MRIAIIGSAPSSIRLAPFGDPTFKIWACSPGTYPILPRCDKFFELHRWEPGVIGKPDTQVPWFSPEYCAWMARQQCVVMVDPVPEIHGAVKLDVAGLTAKYGSYFFTSSIAWMLAMAIDEILLARASGDRTSPVIGLWGVDMAATEEWAQQRPGCIHFIQIAQQLGITIAVPPESDLLLPPPLYGVCEHNHMHIKLMARKKELESRMQQAIRDADAARINQSFLQGAIDDLNYVMGTWIHDRSEASVTEFNALFNLPIPTQTQTTVTDSVPIPVAKGNGADHGESFLNAIHQS